MGINNNARPWDMVAAQIKGIRYLNDRRLGNTNGDTPPGSALINKLRSEQEQISQVTESANARLSELYAEIERVEAVLEIAHKTEQKIQAVWEQEGLPEED